MTLLTRTGPPRRLHRKVSASAGSSLSRTAATVLTPSALALGRTLVGLTMLARPAQLPALLDVERGTGHRTGWVVQMLGAREVALGVGAWAALRRGGPAARLWLAAGLLADTVDALAVGAAVGRGRVRAVPGAALVAVATTAAAVQGAALADRG